MSFVLKLKDVLVGRSDLASRDREAGLARGVFRPGLGWALIEPIFSIVPPGNGDERTNERFRRARDTLALALYTSAGQLLETSRIDIQRDPTSSTGLRVDVSLVDDTLWRP
jgi:hypothetical protein